MMRNIEISNDKSKLDLFLIHDFISTKSYWGRGRTITEVKSSIDNCVCFGVYHENQQIGFARVLTDKTIFAYIMDVFIVEAYRRLGVSKKLLAAIISHSDVVNVKKVYLATKDAHGLYEQFGFKLIEHPEYFMIKE